MPSAAQYLAQIERQLGDSWLPRIYRERILKIRTRSYQFPPLAKRAAPEIHHTLLGIEVKLGRHRMLCPDLDSTLSRRLRARRLQSGGHSIRHHHDFASRRRTRKFLATHVAAHRQLDKRSQSSFPRSHSYAVNW